MTTKSLFENSEMYYKKSNIYEIFSNAEDKPNKIYKFFLPIIKNKIVLDLGCGNGKYLELFSKHAKLIYGLDKSKSQLQSAQKKTKNYSNIILMNSDVEKIPLENNNVDLIFASWVLGTIENLKKRMKIINEAKRILKPQGSFYLIENDYGGEFEDIRGRVNDPLKRTINYNNWLTKIGFQEVKQIKTYFEFQSINECKKIIGTIWGQEASQKCHSNIINHLIG